MTEPRKQDKPSDKGFLPVPEPTPQAVPVEVPYDPPTAYAPEPAALLLLSDRVTAIEEALAGLAHTYTDQQASLARLQKQVAEFVAPMLDLTARLGEVEGMFVAAEETDLVGLAVTPQVAAAIEALFAFIRTDQKFAYDLGLAARRQEKVRHGPLTGLLQAIVGTQVGDGT